MIRHAGCLALRVQGRWAGALIEGPSGVGKSDLALRCLAAGFRLVADDRAHVFRSGDRLYARAPGAISGLIEARGLDILPVAALPVAEVRLLVRCVGAEEAVERLPDRVTEAHEGVAVPVLSLHPLHASAPAKLRLALEAL